MYNKVVGKCDCAKMFIGTWPSNNIMNSSQHIVKGNPHRNSNQFSKLASKEGSHFIV